MKTAKLILAFFALFLLLLPFQAGQSKADSNFSGWQKTELADNSDAELSPNRSQIQGASIAAEPQLAAQSGSCHFGITLLPPGIAGNDLSALGIESYLNWGNKSKDISVAENIQYYRVLEVSDASYASNYAILPSRLAAYPGSVWIIGNEPDSQVIYQDHISAASYGERYFNMATRIRELDPTAKIAFGSVIQPTPVRLHYLSIAIDRMTQLAGNRANALALIDIYSIHSFILNEQPLYDANGKTVTWGAGIPVGYDPTTWPPYQTVYGHQTYDAALFESRVYDFRRWMFGIGEQAKPLWITEYGSLFPVTFGVSELTSATFMDQTFDFMLGTKDPLLGNSSDEYRLVQKWLWYSLNDDVNHFGGSLYNPLTHQLTIVGEHFISYNPSLSAVPAVNPDVYIDPSSVTATPGPFGYYKIMFKVSNNVSSDRLTLVRAELFLGSTFVGSVELNLPRCSGKMPVSFNAGILTAGESYTFTARVSLISTSETDIDPLNNEITFQQTMPTSPFSNIMIPIIYR